MQIWSANHGRMDEVGGRMYVGGCLCVGCAWRKDMCVHVSLRVRGVAYMCPCVCVLLRVCVVACACFEIRCCACSVPWDAIPCARAICVLNHTRAHRTLSHARILQSSLRVLPKPPTSLTPSLSPYLSRPAFCRPFSMHCPPTSRSQLLHVDTEGTDPWRETKNPNHLKPGSLIRLGPVYHVPVNTTVIDIQGIVGIMGISRPCSARVGLTGVVSTPRVIDMASTLRSPPITYQSKPRLPRGSWHAQALDRMRAHTRQSLHTRMVCRWSGSWRNSEQRASR